MEELHFSENGGQYSRRDKTTGLLGRGASLPSGTSSGRLRFSYTTMMTTRMRISTTTPRKGQRGASWLRTLRMEPMDLLPTALVALHRYSPGSLPMSRFSMLSSV